MHYRTYVRICKRAFIPNPVLLAPGQEHVLGRGGRFVLRACAYSLLPRMSFPVFPSGGSAGHRGVRATPGLVSARHPARGSESDAEPRWGLPGDPENWPVVRLPLIDPWHEGPGIWSEETSEWVRTLGAVATAAHEKYDPFGRRPTPS